MAKQFAPRVSKRKRRTIDLSEKLGVDFKYADERLLDGAKLDDIKLADIIVKDQVRTKFNDNSIKELAENIKQNGLIQPLVLHRKGIRYVLICGERRYRAMMLINQRTAPCFVLDGKTEQELMAIQFSENSSREALHFIDRANGILNYQKATKASERKIQAALSISKSEVHRSLLIAKLPEDIKDAAKVYDIEKYVLIEFDALANGKFKKELKERIITGNVTKRAQLRRLIKAYEDNSPLPKQTKKTSTRSRKKATLSNTVSANAFLKALKDNVSSKGIDKKTEKMLKNLLAETRDIVDL